MRLIRMIVGVSLGAAALLVGIPFLLAGILSIFFGPAPLVIVAVFYAHAFAWPFALLSEFDGVVRYSDVIERSSVIECEHAALALAPDAQPQPFAASKGDLDWQPMVSGPLDAQPKQAEHWLQTPLPKNAVEEHLFEMEICGLSMDTRTLAQTALSTPGSWVAYDTRGMDEVLIYSHPHGFALQFSNET